MVDKGTAYVSRNAEGCKRNKLASERSGLYEGLSSTEQLLSIGRFIQLRCPYTLQGSPGHYPSRVRVVDQDQ